MFGCGWWCLGFIGLILLDLGLGLLVVFLCLYWFIVAVGWGLYYCLFLGCLMLIALMLFGLNADFVWFLCLTIVHLICGL